MDDALKKSRKRSPGIDPNAWMVTFSDLVMLLLAFFVLVFSTKEMNPEAAGRMMTGLARGGGVKVNLDVGSDSGEALHLEEGDLAKHFTESSMLSRRFEGNLVNLKKIVTVTEDKRGIIVTIDSTHLFDSGKTEIRESGRSKLKMMGELLKFVSNDIVIMGHSDNTPVADELVSNNRLSFLRALSVRRFLVDKGGVDPEMLATGGYGDKKPLIPNTTEENRSKNRRIEFILIK